MQRYEFCLCGTGGQGLILGALILAEGVAIHGGKNVAMSQRYAPEPRGGISIAEVIISKEEIDYPKITKPDFVLALSQEACNFFSPIMKENGILLVDSDLVKTLPGKNVKKISLPFINSAVKIFKKSIVLNMMCLGTIIALTNIATLEDIKKAILSKSPRQFVDTNIKALIYGFELYKKNANICIGKL